MLPVIFLEWGYVYIIPLTSQVYSVNCIMFAGCWVRCFNEYAGFGHSVTILSYLSVILSSLFLPLAPVLRHTSTHNHMYTSLPWNSDIHRFCNPNPLAIVIGSEMWWKTASDPGETAYPQSCCQSQWGLRKARRTLVLGRPLFFKVALLASSPQTAEVPKGNSSKNWLLMCS